jgi:xanthine dehydrogenase accessory factor
VVRTEPPTSAHPGDKAVITAEGKLRGWIGGTCSEPVVRREALRALAEGTPQLIHIVGGDEVKQTRTKGELMIGTTCPSGGSLDIFIEPRLPKPLLLVFGDTPAAEAMVKLGELTGFRTQAVRQPDLGALQVPGGERYAVVATMGHFDEEALEAALSHPDMDVSLVASARRTSAVREALLRRGLDEHALSRLRSAAGKVRGATQEEIALLALAEIVAERRRRGRVGVTKVAQVTFVTDPVCGMTVDPLTSTHRAEHGGRTYWFCADGCKSEFLREPERYLQQIEAV